MKNLWKIIKRAVTDFFADDLLTLAAAMSFYTILSLAPIAVLLVVVAGFIGQDAINSSVSQAERLMGPPAGDALQTVISRAQQQRQALTLSAILSLGAILFTALGAFVQFQYSMNRIWGIQSKGKSAVWDWVRKRLLSVLLLVVIAVLLLASVVVSSVVSGLFPEFTWINTVASLAISLVLFAIIYKYLPDARIAWRDVWVGAIVTSILFSVGIWAIGVYLGRSGAGSLYGAAGSLVVFLLWVYYAALILFLGAEITQAYCTVYGDKIKPNEYFEHIDKHEHQQQGT